MSVLGGTPASGVVSRLRPAEQPVDFSVLGPIEIRRAGVMLPLPGRRERQLISVLLRYARQRVPVDLLVQAVWPVAPPPSAARQVRSELSLLRQLIGGPHDTIVATANSYLAQVDRAHLDAERFEDLLDAGSDAAATGDLAAANRLVCDALHQWRGPALADVEGPLRDQWAHELHEERMYAVELRFDVELRRGHHALVVRELTQLVEGCPPRVRLVGQLMLALHGSGHRADALRLYERMRPRLIEELGAELAGELAAVRGEILRADAPLVPRLRPRPPRIQLVPPAGVDPAPPTGVDPAPPAEGGTVARACA